MSVEAGIWIMLIVAVVSLVAVIYVVIWVRDKLKKGAGE